jgi:hypothetical protein
MMCPIPSGPSGWHLMRSHRRECPFVLQTLSSASPCPPPRLNRTHESCRACPCRPSSPSHPSAASCCQHRLCSCHAPCLRCVCAARRQGRAARQALAAPCRASNDLLARCPSPLLASYRTRARAAAQVSLFPVLPEWLPATEQLKASSQQAMTQACSCHASYRLLV